MRSVCVIGIAGYSGSGKTTLIERILPELKRQGLSIAVIKHTHHNLSVDIEGKDTDRFFRAGADLVFAHDDSQSFVRSPYLNEDIDDVIGKLPPGLDLVIVEGHKDMPLPGIWLEKSSRNPGPADPSGGKEVIFRDDPEYIGKVLALIYKRLDIFNAGRIIYAGLLIGGKSRRMGRPKALLKTGGMTLAEKSFKLLSAISEKAVLLGSGPVPECLSTADRIPDVPGVDGPLAGMLGAFRWAPQSTWIISSVDLPLMNNDAWNWLLGQRRPGTWAVIPKLKGSKGFETTGAVYEPMFFEYAESLARKGVLKLQEMTMHPRVLTPEIPESIAQSWINVNTAEEWQKIYSPDVNK